MIILNTGLSIILWILSGIAGLLILLLVCPVLYDISLDCRELSYDKIDGRFRVRIMFFVLTFCFIKKENKDEKYIRFLFLKLLLPEKVENIKDNSDSKESDDENNSSNFLIRILNKITGFIKKTGVISKKKDRLIRLYENENTGMAVTKAKVLLEKILRHILPKKVSGELSMGFESPDITGKVYSIYSLIDGYLNTDLIVTPDFDNEVFCGKMKIYGIIIPIYVILYALRFICDRHIKITIGRAKKILRG